MKEDLKYYIVKFIDNDFELDVKINPKIQTVWLTQSKMALLFDVDRTRITRYIKNLLNEGELDNSECAFSAHTENDGKIYFVNYYNLYMIIFVGYRVKSKCGILFRKRANEILKEYLLKGYIINDNRVTLSNENYIEQE